MAEQQQHFHETPDSDWQDFKQNFLAWWDRWGNAVLAILLVVAASLFIFQLVRNWRITAHENAWADLAFEASPAALRDVARDHRDPTVRTLAYLRAADLQLGQVVRPLPEITDEDAPAPTDPETALSDAASLYQEALNSTQHRVLQANALLGLAAVAESRQDWDEARNYYQQTLDLVGDNYAVLHAQAEARLAMLSDLQEPVRIAADPAPTTDSGFGAQDLPSFQMDDLFNTDQSLLAPAPGESGSGEAASPDSLESDTGSSDAAAQPSPDAGAGELIPPPLPTPQNQDPQPDPQQP